MAMITYTEAAHRLRMTARLLKWFTSYQVSGAAKLVFTAGGLVDEAPLGAFDVTLRGAWTTRDVPTGISDELRVEARGKCALCDAQTDRLEEAHIDRKGMELPHYCQHPHNLILLCPLCHSRYDNRDKALTNPVVRHRKQQLLSALMEDVDRDVRLTNAVRVEAERARAQMANEYQKIIAISAQDAAEKVWNLGAQDFFSSILGALRNQPVTGSQSPQPPMPILASANIVGAAALGQQLQMLSGSYARSSPVTSGLLHGYITSIGQPPTSPPPSEWQHIEEEPVSGECARCTLPAMLDSYTCLKCGSEHWDLANEESVGHEDTPAGVKLSVELADGSTSDVTCGDCENDLFDVEYQEFCGACAHQFEKLNDDD